MYLLHVNKMAIYARYRKDRKHHLNVSSGLMKQRGSIFYDITKKKGYV